MAATPSRYLTFRAAGCIQALPADAIREIVKLPVTTRVPHAPPGMVGLANVRGTVVPILSVTALQGGSVAGGSRLLVLDRDDPVGLLVDEVREIVDRKGRTRSLDVEAIVASVLRQAPARASSTRARLVSSRKPVADAAKLDLISFRVGNQEFALPQDQVAEVIALPADITRLPDADRVVLGTVEHRGDLLPIVALAPLLGLKDETSEAATRVVIATMRGHLVGLAVTAMSSVLRVDEADVDPVPTVIAKRASEARLQAIARLESGRRLISILAADQIFSEGLMAHMPERRNERLEDVVEMVADATEPFLIFLLGAQKFGVPAIAVEEIVRVPDTLTRLPKAPSFVEGVMNLRGHAIPVIDQRQRFGEETSSDRRRRALVLRMGTLLAAFAVDEVSEIRRLDPSSLAPAPSISDDTRVFDRTATMPDGSIVLMIEPAELLDGTERELLSAMQIDPVTPRT
ncbi:chemotaxis protein CheW [Nostoc sp. 3335mG]|nr:chemotaxis protein CheW [Nostoc sp. 3335mG]